MLERNMFTIQVEGSPVGHIHMDMEPSHMVMDVAEKLSLAYKGCAVNVSMFARNRRTYLNGAIYSSRPDLTILYDGMSDQDKWDWSCLGQITD